MISRVAIHGFGRNLLVGAKLLTSLMKVEKKKEEETRVL